MTGIKRKGEWDWTERAYKNEQGVNRTKHEQGRRMTINTEGENDKEQRGRMRTNRYGEWQGTKWDNENVQGRRMRMNTEGKNVNGQREMIM